MLKTVLAFGLLFLLVSVGFAQQENSNKNSENKGKVIFKADTEFSAQIENQLDAEKAKIGEDVNFVIAEDVKGEGSTIDKGAPLYGRIVNVQKASADNENVSKISVMFDFIKKDSDFVPLTASIVSIEKNSDGIKFDKSPTYDGGTILSAKGKNLQVNKGEIFRIKLDKDITAN